MNSKSSSSSSQITLDSDSNFRKFVSNKVDYLYEVTVVPDSSPNESDKSIVPTNLPLVNPYSAFAKSQVSPLKVFRSLISPKKQSVKEYVQASRLDQHPISATNSEHMITLYIPEDFPRQWKNQGYTHIHFGAVRMALTFHGRKGLPVVARIALLDTRFKKYQHARIATVETTLNAGTVFVTLFPNFNMSLADPYILSALKAQVQIQGELTRTMMLLLQLFSIRWFTGSKIMHLTSISLEEMMLCSFK